MPCVTLSCITHSVNTTDISWRKCKQHPPLLKPLTYMIYIDVTNPVNTDITLKQRGT